MRTFANNKIIKIDIMYDFHTKNYTFTKGVNTEIHKFIVKW